MNTTWNDRFLALFDRCVRKYEAGNRDFSTYYDTADKMLLEEIGCRPREFFDFIEDAVDEEDGLSPSSALLVASVRRDYFQMVLNGAIREPSVNARNIPTFGEELAGIYYLPRILAKARAKLVGELDPDLMYGCGGDRKFLREHGNRHPADFLRRVWAAGDDDHKIIEWLRSP